MGLLARLLYSLVALSAVINWAIQCPKSMGIPLDPHPPDDQSYLVYAPDTSTLWTVQWTVVLVMLSSSLVLVWRAVAYATAGPDWWPDPKKFLEAKAHNANREWRFQELAKGELNEHGKLPWDKKITIQQQVDKECGGRMPETQSGLRVMLYTLNPMGLACMAPPLELSQHAWKKERVYFMLGLPVIGQIMALFGSGNVAANPLIKHLESRIGILQLLLQDVPNFFLDPWHYNELKGSEPVDLRTGSGCERVWNHGDPAPKTYCWMIEDYHPARGWFPISLMASIAHAVLFVLWAIHAGAAPSCKCEDEEGTSSSSDADDSPAAKQLVSSDMRLREARSLVAEDMSVEEARRILADAEERKRRAAEEERRRREEEARNLLAAEAERKRQKKEERERQRLAAEEELRQKEEELRRLKEEDSDESNENMVEAKILGEAD